MVCFHRCPYREDVDDGIYSDEARLLVCSCSRLTCFSTALHRSSRRVRCDCAMVNGIVRQLELRVQAEMDTKEAEKAVLSRNLKTVLAALSGARQKGEVRDALCRRLGEQMELIVVQGNNALEMKADLQVRTHHCVHGTYSSRLSIVVVATWKQPDA